MDITSGRTAYWSRPSGLCFESICMLCDDIFNFWYFLSANLCHFLNYSVRVGLYSSPSSFFLGTLLKKSCSWCASTAPHPCLPFTVNESTKWPISVSAKWGVHINAKYAIYGLLHMLHIKLHISAYFYCIFSAYLTNTVYNTLYICNFFCIFLAYNWLYLHIFSIYLHITSIFKHISGIFREYFLHIWLIQSIYSHIFFAYLKHIIAYLWHITAYNVQI